MLVADFITQVHLAYRGKGSDKAPLSGTQKWSNYLAIANNQRRTLARKKNCYWDFFFDATLDAGSVSASLTYELDDTFFKPADYFYIQDGTNLTPLIVGKPQDRNNFYNVVYITGANPKVVNFPRVPQTSYIGTTLLTPGYIVPEDLIANTDEIEDEIAEWLIRATAAQLARNDPAKDDQYPNLVGEANDLFEDLVANCQTVYGSLSSARVVVQDIGWQGFETQSWGL